MRQILLTYFKTSGKYYSDAYYDSATKEGYDFELRDEVIAKQQTGTLPGLAEGCREFIILVTGETVVPMLIFPERKPR